MFFHAIDKEDGLLFNEGSAGVLGAEAVAGVGAHVLSAQSA